MASGADIEPNEPQRMYPVSNLALAYGVAWGVFRPGNPDVKNKKVPKKTREDWVREDKVVTKKTGKTREDQGTTGKTRE